MELAGAAVLQWRDITGATPALQRRGNCVAVDVAMIAGLQWSTRSSRPVVFVGGGAAVEPSPAAPVLQCSIRRRLPKLQCSTWCSNEALVGGSRSCSAALGAPMELSPTAHGGALQRSPAALGSASNARCCCCSVALAGGSRGCDAAASGDSPCCKHSACRR
ncbi:uncharacterized protein LOC119272790 [Triticum dicoccoides]|uniref:uncharacterized protein LOC119272790 n=1 Tax=Triticum dicoccoides TaxID=85692 RepID=UPI0018908FED|nr:uncharacterized protein LOC119272790 [Triticum dicoccoides]